MQTIGHLKVIDEIILVLVRQKKYSRAFKIRQSGALGVFMEDESYFLEDSPKIVEKLKRGEVVSL